MHCKDVHYNTVKTWFYKTDVKNFNPCQIYKIQGSNTLNLYNDGSCYSPGKRNEKLIEANKGNE